MTAPNLTLIDGFDRSAALFPHRPALEVGDVRLTYFELQQQARSIACSILECEAACAPLVAVLAYRSTAAYAGVLGALKAGKGYVPLNPTFPVARTLSMLKQSGCETIIAAAEAADVLDAVLPAVGRPLIIQCLGLDVNALRARYPMHRFEAPGSGSEPEVVLPAANPESIAYLLFTSGSTGTPKGVPVTQRNVTSYLDYVLSRYGFSPDDRFSQAFDMTFDLSVHDMFVCWWSGACLVAIPHALVVAPARFIREKRLTVWFSVPSVIMFMQRLRTLRPNIFPDLRVSLFCGEPLLESWADTWQQAAPHSLVENVYGPTEATIAIAHYRWNPERGANHCRNAIVPIGKIFASQSGIVVGIDGVIVEPGTMGELYLSGSQVTKGYLNNPGKTRQQFVHLPRDIRIWYRTGDQVIEDESGDFQYIGRMDDQIQVCGHRVELQEIDDVVRRAARSDAAIAVAWPVEAGRADAVYAFLCAPAGTDTREITDRCATFLPPYMVPKNIFLISSMPVNANGKIDRAQLAQRVQECLNGNR